MADAAGTVVVGAGVIGLAIAAELAGRGEAVMLIDRGEPGRGCSYGNAGIIAVSEIFPVISPERLRSLPATLLTADGPAVVRASALPRLMPWLVHAAASLQAQRQQDIIAALVALNRRALGAWRELLARADATSLLREEGMLRLIRKRRDWSAMDTLVSALAAAGVPARRVEMEQIRELEPHLDGIEGAVLHESDAHVANPLQVSNALLSYVRAKGAQLVCDEVTALSPEQTGVHMRTRGGAFIARRVIVANGLAAGALLAPLGYRVPLQAERGYHLMLKGGGKQLSRPVTFHSESCVATPMGADLRLAGTVEFADQNDAANWRRSTRLAPIAQRYFKDALHVQGAEQWVGARPSLPDSLPAIGLVRACPAIGYAFGHQHLGLTQAAITAKLVAGLMFDAAPEVDCRLYDLARFGVDRAARRRAA